MTERMKLLESLQKKNNTHYCPGCNDMTYCAMEDGKPAVTCWCMSEKKGEGVGIVFQTECLCRSCLKGD